MAKVTQCPNCIHDGNVMDKPFLRRDPANPIMALCPLCNLHVANGDGNILFRGRPPKVKETDGKQ